MSTKDKQSSGDTALFSLVFDTENNPMIEPYPEFHDVFRRYYGHPMPTQLPLFEVLQKIRTFDVESDKSIPKEEHYTNFRSIVHEAKRELEIHTTEMVYENNRLRGNILELGEHMQKNIEHLGRLADEIKGLRKLNTKLEETRKEKMDHLYRIEKESDRYVEHILGVTDLEERIGVVEVILEPEPIIEELKNLV